MPFLPPNQQRQSTEGKEMRHNPHKIDVLLFSEHKDVNKASIIKSKAAEPRPRTYTREAKAMTKANSVTEGLDEMQLKENFSLFSYSATYQYDMLHFQKTSDSSNESDILARLGSYKQTTLRKYTLH